ncbi:MAG: hypothetical protein KGI28_02600 [Thaumarchaeota archaeon]|nr:hypothetical protein [Nitrososphaerota archaeon]
MSKTVQEPKELQTETKDIYAIYRQNMQRFFDEVEKSITQYQQSVTNLQRSYTTAWKNIAESAISIQREFANKSGTNTNVSQPIAKMVNDASEEMIKVQEVQNKAVQSAIDATHQSIKTFNETAKSFTDLTQTAMQQWISACTPTRN